MRRVWRRAPQRTRLGLLGCGFLLAALFALAACGGSTSAGSSPTATTAPTDTPAATTPATTPATSPTSAAAATISMASSSFSGNTAVTIKAGQAVNFVSGGFHNLVIGTHGQFQGVQGAPSDLNSRSGVSLSAGDSMAITFANAGTFPITCTFHPSMQATVTVTP